MATALKLGPTDHSKPMELDEFMSSDYEEGYQYELIDGRLYVSPQPNAPGGLVERWILKKLDNYSDKHSSVVNVVYNKARVFVPGRRGVTNPEPDVSAYHDFPLDIPIAELRWQNLSPILVVEVLSVDDPFKDLFRNVELYLQVPSIQEYWILDSRENADEPTMIVRRRRKKEWEVIELDFGDTYTTKLLPGFKLKIDPRS